MLFICQYGNSYSCAKLSKNTVCLKLEILVYAQGDCCSLPENSSGNKQKDQRSKRRRPSFSLAWQNPDCELNIMASALKEDGEKVLVTGESVYESEKYFLAFYVPMRVYLRHFIVMPLLVVVFATIFMVLFVFGGINFLISLVLSSFVVLITYSPVVRVYQRITPQFWENIIGFTAFDANREPVLDEDRLTDLLIGGRLALKLYFDPSVRQSWIPDSFFDRSEQYIRDHKKKLKEEEAPMTDLGRELRELNLELFDSGLAIIGDRRRLESLSIEVQNLELSISEDLMMDVGEYKAQVQDFAIEVNKLRDGIEPRINTFDNYLRRLEEKHDRVLRPSRLASVLAVISYAITGSLLHPVLVLIGVEAGKYTFDYLVGVRSLEREYYRLGKTGRRLETELKLLERESVGEIQLRSYR